MELTDWLIAIATVVIAFSAAIQAWFAWKLTKLEEAYRFIEFAKGQAKMVMSLDDAAAEAERKGNAKAAKIFRSLSAAGMEPIISQLSENDAEVSPNIKRALTGLLELVEEEKSKKKTEHPNVPDQRE